MKSIDFVQYSLHELEMTDVKFKPRKPCRLIAFCTSDQCAKKTKKKSGKYENVYTRFGAVKNVIKDTWFCPDCNSALFWQCEDEVRNVERKLNGSDGL